VTRVGVVDLGTNSTRLLVADIQDGELRELDRRLTITRLGEGVDESGALCPQAMVRVADCVREYHSAIERLGGTRALAYATSAVRDAANGASFLAELESELDLPTRLLSGEEEALFTFRGVAAARPIEALTLVIDLGGGSTELTVGGPDGVRFHTSLDIGCVRLTERFLTHDPPESGQVEDLVLAVRSLLRQQVTDEQLPERGIGVAGTVTTLATLHLRLPEEDPGLVHGHRLSRRWVAAEAARLAATPVADLRRRPGIVSGRAEVIAAGALAIAEILDYFELEELEVSEWDTLHGVALEVGERAR
jgi:exopolyphosphatase/guanosine-5'-triphosphate,3'-diphosphate pyrophosphatase